MNFAIREPRQNLIAEVTRLADQARGLSAPTPTRSSESIDNTVAKSPYPTARVISDATFSIPNCVLSIMW
jgi:hypothetical protein